MVSGDVGILGRVHTGIGSFLLETSGCPPKKVLGTKKRGVSGSRHRFMALSVSPHLSAGICLKASGSPHS